MSYKVICLEEYMVNLLLCVFFGSRINVVKNICSDTIKFCLVPFMTHRIYSAIENTIIDLCIGSVSLKIIIDIFEVLCFYILISFNRPLRNLIFVFRLVTQTFKSHI